MTYIPSSIRALAVVIELALRKSRVKLRPEGGIELTTFGIDHQLNYKARWEEARGTDDLN